MGRVRVVIVDDSATMRTIIRGCLSRDSEIEVVGEAADPYEAREVIKAQSPDVITLDVNMPRMNGLEFLEKIMRLRPTPVIMVSAEVAEGAAASIEALSTGAFDCVPKPAEGHPLDAFRELSEKIKAAAQTTPRTLANRVQHKPGSSDFSPNGRIIAVGASTGGVDALSSLLSAFPANCPPTVITQHMPASFTGSFAQRLANQCAPRVAEAWNGAPLENGQVYIAPGGSAHLEIGGSGKLVCQLREGDPITGHRPSVDALFSSLARQGPNVVGIILTGMGRDGAAGLLELRNRGASTIGQNQASSLVYGMPRAAHELGAVEIQLPLGEIPAAALSLCTAGNRRKAT